VNGAGSDADQTQRVDATGEFIAAGYFAPLPERSGGAPVGGA
jgi:hypothetical protein